MRTRKQIEQAKRQLAEEQAKVEQLQRRAGEGQRALDAAERRQPAVESLVGFLVGTREQNGFGERFRITALTHSDIAERHA